jgi:hypothetical protein
MKKLQTALDLTVKFLGMAFGFWILYMGFRMLYYMFF